MKKNDLYESLTNDHLEVSYLPKKGNYDTDDNERLSNTSFHSLEYSPTGEYDTLNEPICTSLVSINYIICTKKREFVRIWNKTQYSILPRCFPSKGANLRQWDLWGPLFYSLLLSFFLSQKRDTEEMSKTFILVFVIMWVGGVIITINTIAIITGNADFFFGSPFPAALNPALLTSFSSIY